MTSRGKYYLETCNFESVSTTYVSTMQIKSLTIIQTACKTKGIIVMNVQRNLLIQRQNKGKSL